MNHRPDPTHPLKSAVFDIVAEHDQLGVRPAHVRRILARRLPGLRTPSVRTIERWLADDVYHKPTGYAYYAVRPEGATAR